MTVNELKRLDKKINEIQAPFGTGLPILKGYIREEAIKQNTTDKEIMGQYMHWKWSK